MIGASLNEPSDCPFLKGRGWARRFTLAGYSVLIPMVNIDHQVTAGHARMADHRPVSGFHR